MKRILLRIYHSKIFYKHRNYWVLIAICFLFVLFRLPSIAEPDWYGDEGIYQVAGQAMNKGRILYQGIWDNKPPLLYIIYAIAQGDLYIVKFLSLLLGLLSVIFFFFLSLKIFQKNYVVYATTFFYAFLFGTPILEGNIANGENFMLLPIVAAAYFVVSYVQDKKINQLLIAGFLLSFAFAIKIVAIFDFAAFSLFILMTTHARDKFIFKKAAIFIGAFMSLLIIFCLYFFFVGAFNDFINGAFLQNISYVGEQYGAANPIFILLSKLSLLIIAVVILFIARKRIPQNALFIYLWIVFAIYNSFFSDRPYTHYILVILPAFSLLVGLFLVNVRMRTISIVVIMIVMQFSYYHFHIYKKNIGYYINYVQFMTSSKNLNEYQTFFDWNTPRDYKIANFINTNIKKNEEVFLLTNSAQIYALSNRSPMGKYIVGYHITSYPGALAETKIQIEKIRPKYIIQTSEDPAFDELLSSYELKYIMDGTKIYEREI